MIRIIAWGSKHGPLPKYDLIVDAKVLPNPYSVTPLRAKTGLDYQVKLFCQSSKPWTSLVCDAFDRIRKEYVKNKELTVVVTCLGGKHRSVVVAKHLADRAQLHELEVKLEMPHLTNATGH